MEEQNMNTDDSFQKWIDAMEFRGWYESKVAGWVGLGVLLLLILFWR